MERAISTLTQLPTSGTQITEYVTQLKNDIIGGYIPATESAIIIKSFEKIIEELKKDKDVKDYLYSECEKYQEKTIEVNGAQIQKTSRTTYDFSRDEEYSMLKDQERELKAMIKARETILKVDRELYPSTTTEFLTIKLNK